MSRTGHIFLSYPRFESEFALRLGSDLKNAGVDLWIDRFEIETSDDWEHEIELAINSCSAMITILSPAFIRSRYCPSELSRAIKLNKLIIPVLLQTISHEEWPLSLDRIQYGDFRDWREESNYQSEFAKLIDTIRQTGSKQVGNIPSAYIRYVNKLIAELEGYEGVLEYTELRAQIEESIAPKNRKVQASGLSLIPQNNTPSGQSQKKPLKDIHEAIKKNPHFVLIGDPGSGKTTIIRHLATEAARQYLKNPEKSPIPLFVRLPSWDKEQTFPDFMLTHWMTKSLPTDIDPIGLLYTGGALLYLDGLNEMGSAGIEKAKLLKSWLALLKEATIDDNSLQRLGNIIITCRRVDYQGELKLDPLPVVLVEEMNEREIREFVSKYLEPDKIGNFLDRVISENKEQTKKIQNLHNLARNPYLLAALITIYKESQILICQEIMASYFVN